MLIQVVINSRRLQATKLLIAKQRAVAEERDTFWHLAANYLRAPITLMVGGVELLSTDKDIRLPAVAQLEVFTKNLQKKVFAIMSRIEQSRTLQDIHWPELQTGSKVLAQLKFWLPVGLVACFAILMNLVAKNYRNLSVSTTNLAIQLLIFILVSVLFYWVLSALGMVNRKRKQAEALLEQQSASLDDARTNFIEQSAATLDNDLSEIESQLDSLPANAASMSIVREGAHRLRTLINSFELLVAAQNDKLNTLSPSSSHMQLNTIFDSVIASLNPLIAQKHIRVVKPDFGRVTLPGNSLLLNQVIGSVLSNAVAFSPVGSTIEISLKSHKGDVQLSVTNQGQIIDENQLSQVFRPFMKADGNNALQLDHGGLGVNLYIDSLIMRHLSGAIDVSSDTNKGTTMTMRWPTVRPGMAG
jgi:signal transduction histidine kinase